ncbi:MAG TPA: SRPBCC family protein [Candidatus Kapabacteria bacterium]|nr:SRPBCC family protein [Candidatus Kapabacteria bacterium]
MQTRSIRQSATFNVKPSEVYETLMDSRKHTAFSGAKANISRKVGGKFTAFDGYCEGRNLELVANKKIVQEWRGSDWPKGSYSKVTYSLKAVKGGTKLSFYQSGVPAKFHADIKQGWIDFYWNPMKKVLNK